MLVGDVSAALFEKINRCLFFSQEKGCKAEMLEGCFASKRKDVRVVCYVRKAQQEAMFLLLSFLTFPKEVLLRTRKDQQKGDVRCMNFFFSHKKQTF